MAKFKWLTYRNKRVKRKTDILAERRGISHVVVDFGKVSEKHFIVFETIEGKYSTLNYNKRGSRYPTVSRALFDNSDDAVLAHYLNVSNNLSERGDIFDYYL